MSLEHYTQETGITIIYYELIKSKEEETFMGKSKIALLIIVLCACLSLCACSKKNETVETRTFEAGTLTVTFDFERQSGSASNQFAVWIEDIEGNYVNTLYATQWTVQGGYRNRPDSIALWVEKSELTSMQKSDVDAVSGATPRAGNLSYTWDLTDRNGDTVPHGEYMFFVEGTLRWRNYMLYCGLIAIGNETVTVQADVEFVYEASDRQAALTSASSENSMITAVTASFVPVGN